MSFPTELRKGDRVILNGIPGTVVQLRLMARSGIRYATVQWDNNPDWFSGYHANKLERLNP